MTDTPNPDANKKRIGWRWADGKMHSSPPPSSEDPGWQPWMIQPVLAACGFDPVPADPPTTRQLSGEILPVPADFQWTPRVQLRVQAMDFVLRAAGMTGKRINGGELMDEAEALERWLASP